MASRPSIRDSNRMRRGSPMEDELTDFVEKQTLNRARRDPSRRVNRLNQDPHPDSTEHLSRLRTDSKAEELAGRRNESELDWVISLTGELDRLATANEYRLVPKTARTIFRVRRHVRRLKPEHYNPEIMYLGLMHKSRFDREVNLTRGDKFRITVAGAFLSLVKQFYQDWNWTTLCRKVVPNPQAMQTLYELELNDQRNDESVRAALTLDAVFLASYMGGYLLRHRYDKFPFPVFTEIVIEEGLHFHNTVSNDIFKLENQIPLQLVLNALEVLFCGDKDQALEVLNEMCWEMVLRVSSSLPGFLPETSRHPLNFTDCDHLLACLCRVMRGDMKSTEDLDEDKPPARDRRALKRLLPFPAVKERLEGWRWAVQWFVWRRGKTVERTGEKSSPPDSKTRPRNWDGLATNISLPSVVKLREAGIHCEGDCRGTADLVPIFKSGLLTATLHIPTLSVVHRTESLWKNMVAYEIETVGLRNLGSMQFIYFLKFMDEMINTEQDEDVRMERKIPIPLNEWDKYSSLLSGLCCMYRSEVSLLQVLLLRHGRHPVIKKNLLGTEKDAAELFNTVVQSCTVVDSQIRKWGALRKQIDGFSKQKYRLIVLEFLRTYLGKPWLVISLLAATVLLVLTFVQTLYAILAFYPET